MSKRKLPLLFLSTLIFLILIFTGCSPKTYQLSTSVEPSGGGVILPSQGTFQGDVTLVATAAPNYAFNGWSDDAYGNSNALTIRMDSDKNIVAKFTLITPLTTTPLSVTPVSGVPAGATARCRDGTYSFSQSRSGT